MRKLFEINSDIEKLLDKNSVIVMGENGVDTETGEVFNLAERLNALQIEKNEKIKSVVVYMDDLESKLDRTKAIKSGEAVPGAEMRENYSVSIL